MTVDAGMILKILNDGGIIALLVVILVGGVREWWVFGWYYTEMSRERDTWKELALSGTSLAERAVNIAQHRKTTA